jgi:hypothetical protein
MHFGADPRIDSARRAQRHARPAPMQNHSVPASPSRHEHVTAATRSRQAMHAGLAGSQAVFVPAVLGHFGHVRPAQLYCSFASVHASGSPDSPLDSEPLHAAMRTRRSANTVLKRRI